MLSRLYISIFFVVISFAWFSYWFNLQQILVDEYNKFNSDKTFDQFDDSYQLGNIYDVSYNMVRNAELSADKEALSSVLSRLRNDNPNCSATEDDIFNIFMNDKWGQRYAKWVEITDKNNSSVNEDTQQSMKKYSSKFKESCIRVSLCASKDLNADISKEDYQAKTVVSCTDAVFKNYDNLKSNVIRQNTMKSLNFSDDIFSNGSLEDSPYDILVDIQKIWDVFFAENKEVEKTLFYKLPTYNKWSSNWANSSSISTSLFEKFTQWLRNGMNKWLQGWSNNLLNPYWNLSTWQALDSNSSNLLNNWSCILNNNCSTPNTWFLDTDFNILALSWVTTMDWLINSWLLSGNVLNTWNLNQVINNFRTLLVWDPTWPAANALLNSCMKRCDWLWFLDKPVCQARCLCQTSNSVDEIYRIKFCIQPAKWPDMNPWAVKSIEEIVNKILWVVTNLKESGQLMPHRRATEMLETALQLVDLADMFAFDTIVTTKPVFGSDDEKKKKTQEKEWKEYTQLYENALLWEKDMEIKQQRDKYLLFPPEYDEAFKEVWSDLKIIEQRKQMIDEVMSQMNTDLSANADNKKRALNLSIFKTYSEFIDYNIKFWEWTTNKLNELNKVSDSASKK